MKLVLCLIVSKTVPPLAVVPLVWSPLTKPMS